jgi:hypothetical protein
MFTFSPKFFPTLLETVGLHALNRNVRDFGWLHFDFKHHNCSSARCALMANASSRDSGAFSGKSVLINSFLDVGIFSR